MSRQARRPRRDAPSTAVPRTEDVGTVALLRRNRGFARLALSNFFFACAIWIMNVGAALFVYDLTESTLWVGGVSVAQFALMILLAPVGGSLIDRVDKFNLLVAGQCVSAVGAGGVALWVWLTNVDTTKPWPVLVAAGVIGGGIAVTTPCAQAMLPSIVAPAEMPQAVAFYSGVFNIGRAVGPAIATALIVTLGPAAMFTASVLAYGAVIVLLLGLPNRAASAREPSDAFPPGMLAAVRHVARDRALLIPLACVLSVGFAIDPPMTLAPAMSDLLGGGERLAGSFPSAFGFGAITAILCVSALRRALGPDGLRVLGLTTLGTGMIVFGFSRIPLVSVVALFVAGIGFLVANTSLTAAVHEASPDALRGRVMALWSIAFLGARPLASSFNGLVSDRLTPRVGCVIAGLVALIAASALRRWTSHRRAVLAPAA